MVINYKYSKVIKHLFGEIYFIYAISYAVKILEINLQSLHITSFSIPFILIVSLTLMFKEKQNLLTS